jgi:hypothetical protein
MVHAEDNNLAALSDDFANLIEAAGTLQELLPLPESCSTLAESRRAEDILGIGQLICQSSLARNCIDR